MKKKSGAAQRLVSLVLALGLIFTLAPASVFAGDEVPASSTVTAIADEEPVVDGTEPVVDGTEPVVDGTEPVVDGTEPVADGTEPVADGTEPVVDGTEPVVDGTEPVADGTEPVVDGTEPVVDGTEPVVDGTEPVVEEELSSQQTALLAASVPAVMKAGPESRGAFSFTFSDQSSDGVELWYATWEWGILDDKLSELTQLKVGHGTNFFVSPTSVICFFIKVPAGYELDFDNCSITNSKNNISQLPLTDGYGVEHFDELQQEAINNGCTHGFSFGGVDNFSSTVITLKTKPIVTTYTVDKSAAFDASGAYFVEELPSEVLEGKSLSLTLYGPNDDGVTRLIQNLTVLDNGEEKNLRLPMNGDNEPTVTKLDGATITVQYEGIEMVEGWLRTKYSIVLSNVKGNITFDELTSRKWVEKAVNVKKLEGIEELWYAGPDKDWKEVNVEEVTGGSVFQAPFSTLGVGDILKGHYQIVNFRFKLAEGYNDYNLELFKKNGTIDKSGLTPNDDGYYEFSITIGAVLSGDDIEVWFGDDTYQVDMFLTAEKTTTTTYPAKFYVHEAGSNVYYPVGDGTVDFGKPTWEYEKNPIDLDIQENLDKVLTAPKAKDFGKIPVDGVSYEYSATAGVPNTYTFEGWDVAKTAYLDQSGPDAILEWHVDGIIVLHKALPDTMKPEVADFEDVYDGTAKTLSITYPDGKTEDNYTIEYQDANGNWVVGNPTLTNVDKLENLTIRFTMDGYAPYVAPDTYTLEVTKRPLTLRVNDDKIEDGERIPAFSYTITSGSLVSGQSITGVTYGGYKDELGIYDVNILTYKIVAGATDVTGNYEVTLLPGVFTIGTSGGGGGTTPTPNPNPNPTPVPVPVEPETPVTPVAPVTPDEEEEEPAEVEDIEDEETPQASPDTDADKEEDKTENIEDEETAQAGAPGEGNWALLNLILMVLTVVAGLVMLALRFARKTGMAHLLGIVPAIVALVAFFVTEDMSLPMAMTDKWTLIMALIAVVQVVLLVLGRNGAQEDDQPREQY